MTVIWTAAASGGSALVAFALLGGAPGVAIVAGLLGPLAAAAWSWMQVHETFRRRPEDLTAVMIKGFAGKAVFFAAYVAVALKTLALDPPWFVAGFTACFVGVYLAEALWLRRLFADAMRAPVDQR